jgi:CheY-like chemotaxis protein
VLSVSDTGHGMPPEIAERVFEPFFTTKEQGKGTGLGLATVYGIVTQAGGAVSVRTAVGAGTTFSLYVPQARASLQLEAAAPPLPVAGGTETVLLAEDEDAVRRLTKRILGQAGYTVLEAPTGAEALRIAEQHGGAIQLVLTDLVMPGMSGRDLARSLLALRPGLRVVFMSGYFQESIGGEHARHFVPKPFTQEDLLRRVREALDEDRG